MTNYLITGGAGFIGSHLVETLLSQGKNNVFVIDDLSTGRLENIKHLLHNPKLRFIQENIINSTTLENFVSQSDVVFHLAAAVGVKLIMERPVHTIETNIGGTEAILKAASRYGCKILIASSSEVYGKANGIPFSEDHDILLGAPSKHRWAYAASKLVDECLGLAYYYEQQTEVVLFRLFNTVGPRQTGQYGMVIPRFVEQALQGKPITIYGDGNQKRCFCDVRDVINALIYLSESSTAIGQIINIGNVEEISIQELAELIKKITNSSSQLHHIPYDVIYANGFEDIYRRVPNINKLNLITGWKPRYQITDILTRIVEYEMKQMK
jgi:UDP-glucose 4-epimerase